MAVRSGERVSIEKRRINAAFLTILACYLLLMARLLYLQGLRGADIRTQATHDREQRIRHAAHRGSIFSRDGTLFATSLYAGDVGFDPSMTLTDGMDAKTRRKVEERLAQSITTAASLLQISEPELAAFVRKARDNYNPRKPKRFARIRRGLSMETAQSIRDARPRLLGFTVQDGSKRVYASGDNAAHVVGFVNAGGEGQAGLERSCGSWLKGKNGSAIAEMDDHHREIPETLRNFLPVKDGLDIHTTLDANAQHVATEEAQKIIAQYHPKGVSIVALDPNNGDVLALVSAPNFDPNPDKRAELSKLPKDDLPEHFRDRCVAQLYEPGSTLKALTIAAALDKGIVTMDSGFYCSGELKVSKKTIHCAHGEVHGDENVRDILRHSCNVGAAEIGMRMTARKLRVADEKFGLLDKLDLQPARYDARLLVARQQ